MRATSFDLDYQEAFYAAPRRARRAGERAALGMGLAASVFLCVAARTSDGPSAESAQKLALGLAPVAAAPGSSPQEPQPGQVTRVAKFTAKASMAAPELSAGALVKSYSRFDLAAPGFAQEKKTLSSRDTSDENGRIDTLTMGDFAHGGPFVRIDVHRGLGPAEANPDFFLDMTRRANRQFLTVNKIVHPAPLNTKFGAFEAADMRIAAADGSPGAEPRPCVGARLVDKSGSLEIAGLFCPAATGAPFARATVGCLIDSLAYAPAGADDEAAAFFERANAVHAALCPNSAGDDVTASIPTDRPSAKTSAKAPAKSSAKTPLKTLAKTPARAPAKPTAKSSVAPVKPGKAG